ncbi:MAG: (4Fe-4S)-binding protein [Bacteroidota bacterium]
MDTPTQKHYSNGEVTIVWKAKQCIHAANCVNGLPEVFDAKARPWINAEGASTERIIDQVNKCPSGALSYFLNTDQSPSNMSDSTPETLNETPIQVLENGPLMVNQTCRITLANGEEVLKEQKAFLCRCGASANKPFCDGAHKKIGFEG